MDISHLEMACFTLPVWKWPREAIMAALMEHFFFEMHSRHTHGHRRTKHHPPPQAHGCCPGTTSQGESKQPVASRGLPAWPMVLTPPWPLFCPLPGGPPDFPGGTSGKEPVCQRRRRKTWVGKIPGRRAWQPTPVFLPGKSHGQRSLAGYSTWGCKESDTTEVT